MKTLQIQKLLKWVYLNDYLMKDSKKKFSLQVFSSSFSGLLN